MQLELAEACLDQRLLSAYNESDASLAEAWDAWCNVYEGEIVRYLHRYANVEPEEIFWDAIVATHENIQNGKYTPGKTPLVAYVKTIAKNKSMKASQLAQRSVELSEEIAEVGSLSSDVYHRVVEELVIKEEFRQRLICCILCLPQTQAVVVMAYYLYQVRTEEIASGLGMTEAAVRQTRSRAVKKLPALVAQTPGFYELCVSA